MQLVHLLPQRFSRRQGPRGSAWKVGDVGMCDLPLRTAQNAIEDIWANHKDVRFVLWLGDNQANVFFQMQRTDHRKIMTALGSKLAEHFGPGRVYPVLGNHEGLPRDHMDFTPGISNWLRDIAGDVWKQWLSPESVETVRRCGYYSELHPGTRLRIVGLNSLGRGSTNSFIWANTTNVCGQFTWLKDVLYRAERNGEKVLIIEHYPPRNGFANNQWSERFSILMERFANIVVGHMAGHTHQDSFQVFTTTKKNEFAGRSFEHPSMTSDVYVHPSYRIYDMDPSTYVLTDYEQYRLNLTKANAEDRPVWELAYKFRNYYHVGDMEDRTLAVLARKISHDDGHYRKFAWMQFAQGPRSVTAMKDLSRKKSMLCKLTCTDYGKMEKCVGGYEFWTLFHIRHYMPPWEYAVY